MSRELARLAAEGGDLPHRARSARAPTSAPSCEHLGIASLNLEFGGEDDDAGIYHSRYDSFDHFIRFGDPTFEYGVALAQGRRPHRAAHRRRGSAADALRRFQRHAGPLCQAAAQAGGRRAQGRAAAAQTAGCERLRAGQPIRPGRWRRPSACPTFRTSTWRRSIRRQQRLRQSAQAYEAAYAARAAAGLSIPGTQLRKINGLMASHGAAPAGCGGPAGPALVQEHDAGAGPADRLGVKTVPAVREALEARDWSGAEQYAASPRRCWTAIARSSTASRHSSMPRDSTCGRSKLSSGGYLRGVTMSVRVMRKFGVGLTCLSLTCLAGAALPQSATSPAGTNMLGFTAGGAAQERDLEQRFDAQLSAPEMRDWLKRLSSEPNQVGSPHDKANAELMLAQFKQWGWDAHIETFDVLYPTPKQELVEMVAPTTFKATLHEPPVKGDRTSALRGRACRPTTSTAPTATSRRRWCMSTTACPTTTRNWRAWRRRQGQDRDRALRRRLARPEAEARPRARRGRLPHLFRSARRRLFQRRRLSQGRLAAAGRRAARLGARTCSCIPAIRTTPGYGSVPGAKHLAVEGRQDHPEDSGAADLLRRRDAAAAGAGRPGRTGKLARGVADHLSRRRGAGQGAHGRQVRLEPEADL